MERFRNDDREFRSVFEKWKAYFLFSDLLIQVIICCVCLGWIASLFLKKADYFFIFFALYIGPLVLGFYSLLPEVGLLDSKRLISKNTLVSQFCWLEDEFLKEKGKYFSELEKVILSSSFTYFFLYFFCPNKRKNSQIVSMFSIVKFMYYDLGQILCRQSGFCRDYFLFLYRFFSLIPLITGLFLTIGWGEFTFLLFLVSVGASLLGFVIHLPWYSRVSELFEWGEGPEEAKRIVLEKLREQDSLKVFTDEELSRSYNQLVEKLRNIHFITTKAWQNIQEKELGMTTIPFAQLESYTEEDRLADEKEKIFMKPFLQKIEEEDRVWRERQKLYEEKFKPTGFMN